jgi:hypothetical protein
VNHPSAPSLKKEGVGIILFFKNQVETGGYQYLTSMESENL